MDVELFIYGVPYGEGFWGKEEDRKYFGSFYNTQATDKVRFLVQVRESEGKPYCYYNYLVYKDVLDNDGRSGSYFGISLRIGAYCKDVANMYRILDTVFNVHVTGKLLKADRTKLKYAVSDFADAGRVLEDIKDNTLHLLRAAFSNESFTSLDGFATGGSNCPTYNLYDCTAESMMPVIRQYGKAVISPYYPNERETAACRKYEIQIQADANARAREKDEMRTSLSSTIEKVGQLEKEISRKDGEIDKLKSDMRNIGQTRKAGQIVAPLVKPVTELATILRDICPAVPERGPAEAMTRQRKPSSVRQIRRVMPFINLCLLLWLVFHLPGGEETRKDNHTEEKVSALTKIEDSLKQSNGKQEENRFTDSGLGDSYESPYPYEVQIDIIGYIGYGSLKKGRSYKVQAINGVGMYGEWHVKGAYYNETTDPNIIQVTPSEDSVLIEYRDERNGQTIQSRHLRAQQS